MTTAFVLINTGTGDEKEVLTALMNMPGVKEANPVYGVYDIIARLEAETMEDIKKTISSGIRRLNKVRSTITMIVVP